jgi:hypothetical protein
MEQSLARDRWLVALAGALILASLAGAVLGHISLLFSA